MIYYTQKPAHTIKNNVKKPSQLQQLNLNELLLCVGGVIDYEDSEDDLPQDMDG